METRILLLTLCLTLTNTVFALECYSTEIDTLKNNSRNWNLEGQKLSETVVDCEGNLAKIIGKDNFSCYQYDLRIDGKSYWIRSCHVQKDCELLKHNVKSDVEHFYPKYKVQVVNCTECRTDKCNGSPAAASTSHNLKYGVSFALFLLCYLFW